MANKYDYPQAYFDVFTCLTEVYIGDITKIDERTAYMAMEYFYIAAKKKHHQAMDMIKKYPFLKYNISNKKKIERLFK
jgi:hypothetical protein